MTPRILVDENITPALTFGLRQRDPAFKVWRVGDPLAPPFGTPDPEILRWCEARDCVPLTSNRHSMPGHLRDHLLEGRHIPGILLIEARMAIGFVLDLLELAAEIVEPEELQDQIENLGVCKGV